ncbi:hypothetical protein GCM10009118_30440 [Wandonia haliotis]|uniref:Uncharacterized protein n=1 Tax=Wandonia haliotis TaxID=574963 RepID=A0ABN1MTT9_9FLAO
MLKFIVYIFPIAFFFYSCSPDSESIEAAILSGDYSIYEMLEKCDCNALEKQQAGTTETYMKAGTPFTGTCYRNYPSTELVMEEKQLFKGKLYGYNFIYDMEGNLMTKTLYKDGILLNPTADNAITCSCSELTDYRDTLNGQDFKLYQNEFFTGVCYNYYPDSTLSLSAEYRAGVKHGKVTFYNKLGEVIVSELYEEGTRTEQQ